jgi:TrmH family RNA methyltransferase
VTGRPLDITSPTNPRVKALVDLRRRRSRERSRAVPVEGYDELALVRSAGVDVRELYVCPELVRTAAARARLDELAAGPGPVYLLSRDAFEKASYRESPDGWLAVVDDPTRELADIALPADALVLVCEGVEKPGNLGAMLRTADAVGATAVVAADPATDWGNPNVVRASLGAVFTVPVATADAAEAKAWLLAAGVAVVVGTPDAAHTASEADLRGPVAIVVGAEHAGVSAAWRDGPVVTVSIPMLGKVNSLNVATSAALLLYEALRQRSAP